MIQLLKKHYGIIIVAVLIGFIYFLPNISFNSSSGLRIVEQLPNLEEGFSYGVRVREVMDGHFADGDPYLFEYKGQFTTWDYYPLSLLIGSAAKLIGVQNPQKIFIWLDLFLPPITVFIIYALFYIFCQRRSWSMLGALIFVAFPNIAIYKNFFSLSLYQGDVFLSIRSLLEQGFNPDFSRLFVPSLTMIFFSLFLLAIFYLLTRPEIRWRVILLAGLTYGALFYVYFYYWVFATIALGLAIIISAFIERNLARRLLGVIGIGLVVSIPYWTRYYLAIQNPLFHEYIARVGLEYSHRPVIGSVGHAFLVFIIIAVFWRLRKKNGRPMLIWCSATLLATLVVLNIQVIFGFNPQPDHWGSRVNVYIKIIWLLMLIFFATQFFLNRWREKQFDRWLARASLFLIALFLVIALISQVDNMVALKTFYIFQDDTRQALVWIDEHTPIDSVVISPSQKTRKLIPYLTHANSYLPEACMSLASKQEIINRYLDVYTLFKVRRELFIASLTDATTSLPAGSHYQSTNYQEEIESSFSIFCDEYSPKYDAAATNERRIIRDNIVVSLTQGFDESKIRRFVDLPWRADYVFFGPGEKLISKFKPENNSELSLVYRNQTVQIYKINRP